MRALHLDYLDASERSATARWLLAAAAVAFAAHTAVYYQDLTARLAGLEARAPRLKSLPVPAASTEEFAFARDTLGRLSTPWERLFQALEGAQTERVALLSIEPDAAGRTVTVSGEAKDYLAALTYVARLAEQPSLTRVHLVRHETARRGALTFTVSAAWKDPG
jgi:hypothetical protein